MPLRQMRALADGSGVAVQGNLDPLLLAAGGPALEARVRETLDAMRGAPFIFNLGHGIVPQTPPEHVARLVDARPQPGGAAGPMLWLKALAHHGGHRLDGRAVLPAAAVRLSRRRRPGSELSETFKIMEQRLLRAIMNPAMVAVWITGPWLAWSEGVYSDGWLHAKVALVVVLTGFHGVLGRWRKDFAADRNTRSAKFYRIANEVPTLLMVGIVILVV